MKILVTGGVGFIGSNYIFNHTKNYPNDTIVCVDKLTYAANKKTLEKIKLLQNVSFYSTDICNKKEIDLIFKKELPDIVINFAAESHVDRSILNPDIFIHTNILGTQVLLSMALKYSVKRFHQVSTDEVYGDLPLDRPDLSFIETNNLLPSSPYSASKAGADLLCLSFFRTFNLPVTISRCSNNYGAFQFPEKLIPLMIINSLNNKKLPIYGDGLNIRDWLSVEDHCSAIEAIVFKGIPGHIYNIGGSNEVSNIDVVKTILTYTKKSTDLIEYIPDRKGHDRRYSINSSKIQINLNWHPKINFSDGIKNTIQWYIDNHNWWSGVYYG